MLSKAILVESTMNRINVKIFKIFLLFDAFCSQLYFESRHSTILIQFNFLKKESLNHKKKMTKQGSNFETIHIFLYGV
jgi:hypothetical protein